MPKIIIYPLAVGLFAAVASYAQLPKPAAPSFRESPLERAMERKDAGKDTHSAKPAGLPHPGDIMVNCSLPGAPASSIQAALAKLDPTRVNTIRVSGTCNENVTVQSFENLTLIASPGASINDSSGGNLDVLDVADTHEFALQGFAINGGALGVACFDYSVCRFTGNTIQGSAGDGVLVIRAWATFQGDTLQNNAGRGLAVLNRGVVLAISATLQGNGAAGAIIEAGGYLTSDGVISQNNSGNGIRVADHSTLRLADSTLTGNAGEGVLIVSSSEVRSETFTTGNVITGNGSAGVALFDLSYANFVGSDNITGNNVFNPGGVDVFCGPQFSATRGALTNIGGGTTNCTEP
jgi:hypothetical protein